MSQLASNDIGVEIIRMLLPRFSTLKRISLQSGHFSFLIHSEITSESEQLTLGKPYLV